MSTERLNPRITQATQIVEVGSTRPATISGPHTTSRAMRLGRELYETHRAAIAARRRARLNGQ